MPYPDYLNYISANEKVIPAVANRPAMELDLRTASLKERLDTSELGQATILWDVPIIETAKVGMPVYWNHETKQFELAYAHAELNTTYNEYVKSDCANCIGLVYKKESNSSGHIVLSGVVNLPNISEIFTEDGHGRFYLGAEPGRLTYKLLGVSVPVGTVIGRFGDCDACYRVNVNPNMNDLWSHLHYAINLRPKYITNLEEEGWLDVQDEDAPKDAIYQYNIVEGTELAALFPPIPINACSVIIDWNDLDETVGGKDIAVNVDHCLVKVTNSGIYWVDPDTRPFADNTTITINVNDVASASSWNIDDTIVIGTYVYTVQSSMTNSAIVSAIINDIASNYNSEIDGWYVQAGETDTDIVLTKDYYEDVPVICETSNENKIISIVPNNRIMRERLIMSKTQYAMGISCVTSLQPYTNHPFEFVDCNGEIANVGDLYAKFTLKEKPIYIDTYDGYAMRRFNDEYKQEIVPEVNGIAVTGDTITVTSNVEETVEYEGLDYHRGLVRIDIAPLNKQEISPQIMKLGDALEREFNGIMYVGFPRGRESSILAKFEIPNIFTGTTYLNIDFFSSVSGTFPEIECKYQIIRKPEYEEQIPVSQLTFTNLYWDNTLRNTTLTVDASTVFRLKTNSIQVNPGETLIVKLTRPSNAVSYGGDAGIVRINCVLEA